MNNEQQKAVQELRGTNALISELIAAKDELEQAQRERDEALDNLAKQKHEYLLVIGETAQQRDDARLKADGWRGLLEITNTSLRELAKESDDLRAKLLAEQAGGAEMRQTLTHCKLHAISPFHTAITIINKALSTTCGQSFLAERERHVKALEQIESIVGPSVSQLQTIARNALKEVK